MYLKNNHALYDYLLRLEQDLRDRKAGELGAVLAFARAQATSLSTEFLGESRIALSRVAIEGKDVLTPAENVDLEDVLQQLDAALGPSRRPRWVAR